MRIRSALCRLVTAGTVLAVFSGVLGVVPMPLAPYSAAAASNGDWCGSEGETSAYSPVPADSALFDGPAVAWSWATHRVTGDASTGGPGLGVPDDAEAVVLQVSVDPSNAGWSAFSTTTNMGTASFTYDGDDSGNEFVVVVAPDSGGTISWVFSTAADIQVVVAGYFDAGHEGDGFRAVDHRTVVRTSYGIGVPQSGATSDVLVDSTGYDSGVPDADVSAVYATIGYSAPAGTRLLVGQNAGALSKVGEIPGPGSGQQHVTVPVPVDAESHFVLQLRDATDEPVNGTIEVSIDGWFSAGSSTYVPIADNGERLLSNVELLDHDDNDVQVAGVGSIPTFGVSAVLLAVHVNPGRDGAGGEATSLSTGVIRAWPTGTQAPIADHQTWSGADDNTWESFVAPVAVGSDGSIQLTWGTDNYWSYESGETVDVYVDAIGYFCDRDLPTPTSITSGSHPDSDAWVSGEELHLSWTESTTAPGASGIAGYAVAVNDSAFYEPDPVVTHTATTLDTTVDPGRHFVHVRPIAGDGTPGRTAHYAVQSQAACSSLADSSYVPFDAPVSAGSGYYTNETGLMTFSGNGAVPSDAAAVRLNVEVQDAWHTDGAGWVYFYPGDQPAPAGAGQVLFGSRTQDIGATSFVVGLGEYDEVPGRLLFDVLGSAHIRVSVAGYYVENDGLGYTPLTDSGRVYSSVWAGGGPDPSITIDPTDSFGNPTGIPDSDVGAVVASIHVVSPNANGDLQVGPTIEDLRDIMPIWEATANGESRAVQATVPVSTAGTFEINLAKSSSFDDELEAFVLVDVYGWYSASGSEYHPVPEGSRRILNWEVIESAETIAVPIGEAHGLPATGVSAVDGTVHVFPATGTYFNYLSSWPNGGEFSGTAFDVWDNHESYDADDRPMHSVGLHSTVGRYGNGPTGFQIYSHTGTHALFYDVHGYYCRPTPVVTSTSHPDPTTSYPEGNDFVATWTVEEDDSVIDGYQVAFTDQPNHTFASTASPALQADETFTATNPGPGTRWLHVRAVGTTGVPSETAHFRVDIAPGVDGRDLALGYEPWWTFVDRNIGPGAGASVNVATGNLVVQHDDIPPIQAAGDLAFILRRTYNSQDPGSLLPDLFGFDIGEGWHLNLTDLGDLTGLGGIAGVGLTGLPTDPTDVDLSKVSGLTMIDRDGTRHAYTPEAIDAQAGPLAVSADGLSGVLDVLGGLVDDPVGELAELDLAELLSDPIVDLEVDDFDFGNDLALCVDSRYEPPAGVHVAMWRYVLVDLIEGGQAPNSACGDLVDDPPGPKGAIAVGYTTVRPDRVAQTFGFDGRLLSLRDGAGNELAYRYDLSGTLTDVYEPGVDDCEPASPGCRSLSFTENGDSVIATDPAGRHVAYTKTGGKLTNVAVYDSDSTPLSLDPGDLLEQWGYRYDDSITDCGPAGILCEIDTPRVLDENLTPITVGYDAAGRVVALTESGDGTETPPSTSITYTDAYSDVARGAQATRYSGIDAHGRVSQITDAPAGGLDSTPLRQTRFEWDNTGSTCELPANDTDRDNNLCASIRVDVGDNSGGDRRTSMHYNAEGNVIRTTSHGDTSTGGDAVTTSAYRTINYQPDGDPSISEDAIVGNGDIVASTRPDRLFSVTDLTATLSPRGNTATSWADHLTTYEVDATATEPIGSVGTGGTCGSGNSGLSCSSDGPEDRTTINEYNARGQMTSTRTPTTAHPDNGTVVYHYAPDTDGGIAASDAGWLTHVEDAHGNRVTFDYDEASNVTGIWDRNAWVRTTGNPLTSPADGTQITFDTGESANGPWRWDNRTVLPETADDLGNGGATTTTTRDRHGNPTTVTSPRGNATTTVFDARDRATTVTDPTSDVTETRFDDNGNPTLVVEANGRRTATVYDGAGRATNTIWTRAADTSDGIDPGCRAATSNDLTLLDATGTPEVCETTTGLSSFGEPLTVTEPSGTTALVTTNTFDRFGRQTGSAWPTAAGTATTGAAYDLDGNQTVDCAQGWAAQQACAAYTTGPLDPGVTVTDYDTAGRAVATRYDRTPVDAGGNSTGTERTTITTATGYDTAGQLISATDPEGATTTFGYDALGRKTSQTVPRNPGVSNTTRWIYDPSGNTTAVLTPASSDTLGAINVNGEQVAVTGYVWDETNRATTMIEAAQATTGFATLTPQEATGPGAAVVNVRTDYGYDPDGNRIAILAPRAFQSGTVAAPDRAWLTRTDHDERGYPIRTWTTQDPATADTTCPTPTPAAPAQSAQGRFVYGGETLCATEIAVDDAGNPDTVDTPGAKTLAYTYNLDRLVIGTTATAPDGTGTITTTSRYDGAGRVVEHQTPGADGDPWTQTISYSVDGLATATTGADAGGTVTSTSRAFDLAGRTVTVTETGTPNVVTDTTFFSDGLTRTTATGGLTTSYSYDRNGNATSVVQPENTGGTHLVQTFTDDNLLATTAEALNGTRSSERTTTFGYDPAGNKTSEHVATDGSTGRHARYQYQAAGWWLAAEFNQAAPSERISYVHNLDGTLATALDTVGPVDVAMDFAWNRSGAQSSQTTRIDAETYSTVAATHRPDGEVATTTVAHAGQTTSTARSYTGAGSVPSGAVATLLDTTTQTASYTWTDTGQLDTATVGTATESRTYRGDGTVETTTTPSGSHTYSLDAQGRTLSHTPSGFAINPAQSYVYDAPGRVTGDGVNLYDYDGNNNRTLVDTPDADTTTTYRPDNTMNTQTVTKTGGTLAGDFPYDTAGRREHPFLVNQTGTGASSDLDDCVYTYDFLNRTTGITSTSPDGCVDPNADPDDDGNYTAYLHDPLGRQIVQLTNDDDTTDLAAVLASGWTAAGDTFGLTTGIEDLRIYSLDDQLARTITHKHDDGIVDTSVYELDRRLLDHQAAGPGATSHGRHVLNTDGHGNTTDLTSTTGTSICARFYDPFGNTHADLTDTNGNPVAAACEDNETTNRIWYRGGQQDAVDGTYHYGTRHYDPTSATWTTPDTARPGAPLTDLSIGTDPLTSNRYTYVNGDPINAWDPSGHGVCFMGKGLGCSGDQDRNELCIFGVGAGCDDGEDQLSRAAGWGGSSLGSALDGAFDSVYALVTETAPDVAVMTACSPMMLPLPGAGPCEGKSIFDLQTALGQALIDDPISTTKELAKSVVNWDDCVANGVAHCVGTLIPEAAAAFASGGSSTGIRAGRAADNATDVATALRQLADAPQSARQTTILGENMTERVMPFADATGSRTLGFGATADEWAAMTPRQRYRLNDGMLRARIREGDSFRYIGQDPLRPPDIRARFDLTRSELLRLNERGIPYDIVSPLEVFKTIGRN